MRTTTTTKTSANGRPAPRPKAKPKAAPVEATPAPAPAPAPTTAVSDPARAATAAACAALQTLQRQRAVILKSRNMVQNRLTALVAGELGYTSSMTKAEREAKFQEARELIKDLVAGDGPAGFRFRTVVLVTQVGVDAFNKEKAALEAAMKEQAARLPAAAWVDELEQRGLALLFLGIVVGEAGDLWNYPSPGRLWARFGLRPWTFDGQTRMGSTWRGGQHGRLPKEDWARFGYSPRRRSIAYLVGESMMKMNFKAEKGTKKVTWLGPYRQRYNESKAAYAAAHPDAPKRAAHYHGIMRASKLVLLNLWLEWHGHPPPRLM